MFKRTDDYVHFAPPVANHPVVRFLRGLNEIIYRTVAIKRFIGSRTTAAAVDTRVIMNYTDEAGSPALAEKTFGEGRVLLFTTTADLEWSSFPRSILFLAMMQETVRYVVKPDAGDATQLVSTPVRLEFDPTRMQRTATIAVPEVLGGSTAQLTLREDPETGGLYFRYDRTLSAGKYELRLKTPDGEAYARPYVFNVDPAEGNLDRAKLAPIATAVGARIDRADENAFATDDSDRTEFWRSLIYALIICAALETLLAWRFGHHARRKTESAEGKQVFVR